MLTVRPPGEHLLVRTLSFGSPSESLGALCLAFSRTEETEASFDETSIDRVLSILSMKVETDRAIAGRRAEKVRHEQWFETLDAQLGLLDRERQKFVAVVNQSDTYMLVVNADYSVQWTNRAMGDLLNNAGSNFNWISEPVQEVWDRLRIKAPSAGSDRCPIARALQENLVTHHELHRTNNDKMRNLYLTALPITAPDGNPDEILIMIQDITDLDVLRRSESRYRSLFEGSPDAMLMIEPRSSRIVLANPATARLTGYDAADLINKRVQLLHDPEDWIRVEAIYETAFDASDLLTAECRLKTLSGERVVATLSAARFDLDGQAVILVEFRDITERKRLQDELRHTTKMEAIGRLAGGVAHDFNNILTIIMGHSEMLIGRVPKGDRLAKTAESIYKAAVRGSLLTRQLLAFSRKDVLKSEILDLNDVTMGVETMLRSLIGEKVNLSIRTAEEPCLIHADRSQMEQILMNLVANARDAMPPDGGDIWIELSRFEDRVKTSDPNDESNLGNGILLVVRDNGCGMDPETRSHLFEPFFTTKGQGEGTGLGLSSAYGIIQECGGEIQVSSRPGQGTTFQILLPHIEGESRTPFVEAAVRGIYPQGTETILVVEDEDEVRSLAIEVLERNGYSVVEATNGEEAIEILESHPGKIHLLLTDVIMPGMSGGSLVQRISTSHPQIKILYMSGYSNDEIVQHGISVSEASFINKPFTLEALSNKVRQVLDDTHKS
jgi:PAS domain S-box-containing protein